MSSHTTDGTESAAVPVEDRHPLARAVALRWKHALLTLLVGATTFALYQVGGWTVDTTVFAIVTLLVVAYSVATYRADAR